MRQHRGLPGSDLCVGCGHITYRKRPDQLCPRCAWSAEQLIESIEIAALEQDLARLVDFEAYCRRRDGAARPTHVQADVDATLSMVPADTARRPWPDRRPA